MKLGLWEQQLRTNNFTQFFALSLQSDVIHTRGNLKIENRFQSFKKHYVLFGAFASPFAVYVNLLPGRLQIEHCEMCRDIQLREKFHQVGLEEPYKTYLDKDKFPTFYKHGLSMVCYLETLSRHKPRIDTGPSTMMGEY